MKTEIIESLQWLLNDKSCPNKEKLPEWARFHIKELIYDLEHDKDKIGCGKLYKENGDKMCWEGCELCPECRNHDKDAQEKKQ